MTTSPSSTQRSGSAARERRGELREVAVERLEVARLRVDLVAVAEDDRPEAVPLRLEQPAVVARAARPTALASIGSSGGSNGQLQRHARVYAADRRSRPGPRRNRPASPHRDAARPVGRRREPTEDPAMRTHPPAVAAFALVVAGRPARRLREQRRVRRRRQRRRRRRRPPGIGVTGGAAPPPSAAPRSAGAPASGRRRRLEHRRRRRLGAPVDDAKIVRTGTIAARGQRRPDARSRPPATAIRAIGGYIGASQTAATTATARSPSVTYRIPVDRWEDALDLLRGARRPDDQGRRRADRRRRGDRPGRRPRGPDPEPAGQRDGPPGDRRPAPQDLRRPRGPGPADRRPGPDRAADGQLKDLNDRATYATLTVDVRRPGRRGRGRASRAGTRRRSSTRRRASLVGVLQAVADGRDLVRDRLAADPARRRARRA